MSITAERRQQIVSSQSAEKEYRRLFVLGVGGIDVEEVRQYFSAFGNIQELKKTFDNNGGDRGNVFTTANEISEFYYPYKSEIYI